MTTIAQVYILEFWFQRLLTLKFLCVLLLALRSLTTFAPQSS